MDGAVEQTVYGKYLVFWRARCRTTDRELKFKSEFPGWPASFEAMRDWVNKFYRNLELLEYRPWNSSEDSHRILYRVPLQNVVFQIIKPVLAQPEPRRLSLFISHRNSASMLGNRSLLKGN